MGGSCSSVDKATSRAPVRHKSLTNALAIKDSQIYKERYSSASSASSSRLLFVTHQDSKCEYVCRTIVKAQVPCQDREQIQKHFVALNALEHPHLCKFVEVFEDDQMFYMIYEKSEPLTLFKYVQQGESFGEEDAAEYTRQMSMALAVAHEQAIFHGRLSPNKVVIQDSNMYEELDDEEPNEDEPEMPAQVKICDFGQGFILRPSVVQQLRQSEESNNPRDAPKRELLECTAPEIAWEEVTANDNSIMQRPLSAEVQKLDIWGLGCIVFHMLTGVPPFVGEGKELLEKVKTDGVTFGEEWTELSEEAKDWTESMLKVNAGLRPTASQLLRHPWLKMPRARLQKGHLVRLLRNIKMNASEGHFKRMVFRVIAQQLPAEHRSVVMLENAFRFFDRNGDGVLGVKEICEQVKKVQISSLDMNETELMGVVGLLDRDGSQTVNLQEFVAGALNPKLAMKNRILWNAFGAFDRDSDGKVSVDEIEAIIRQIEAGLLGTEQVNGLVKEIRDELKSITPNAYIDFEQFVYIMSTPTGSHDTNKAIQRDFWRAYYNVCGIDCYNVRKQGKLTWDWQKMSQSPASAYRRLNLVNVDRSASQDASSLRRKNTLNSKVSARVTSVRSGKQPTQGGGRGTS